VDAVVVNRHRCTQEGVRVAVDEVTVWHTEISR